MPSVEIYVKTTCGYCWRAKHLLETKGVEYKEIVVDFGGPERERMIERANGRRTVPQIFIGEEPVGGFDDIYELDRAGKLEPMLAD